MLYEYAVEHPAQVSESPADLASHAHFVNPPIDLSKTERVVHYICDSSLRDLREHLVRGHTGSTDGAYISVLKKSFRA